MQGDFTRSTFNQKKHYSAVKMQQGRVLLDADWNEQGEILRHRIEVETEDVVGRCGVPAGQEGFRIDLSPNGKDLLITHGRIYVDGILCELDGALAAIEGFPAGGNRVIVSSLSPEGINLQTGQVVEVSGIDGQGFSRSMWAVINVIDAATRTLILSASVSDFAKLRKPCLNSMAVTFSSQPDYPNPAPSMDDLAEAKTYLVYADVWQRHIASIEDPSIREVALGPDGPDTATRSRTICQVKMIEVGAGDCLSALESDEWKGMLSKCWSRLAASTKPAGPSDKPCIVPPRAGYTRLENQLYRIEIHSSGSAWDGTSANKAAAATFKWSRENGSVAFPISPIKSTDYDLVKKQLKVTLKRRGRDSNLSLKNQDSVEILDDASVLDGTAIPLMQVVNISADGLTVTLQGDYSSVTGKDPTGHPLLRRWDQGWNEVGQSSRDNALPISEGTPLDIEGGIQVTFQPGGKYCTGDYWVIPARTGIEEGSIQWPQQGSLPMPMPPAGIKHHYCSLAVFKFSGGIVAGLKDCRHIFPPLTGLTGLFYVSGDGQEAMPGNAVPEPMQVRVSNGGLPVAGLQVRFAKVLGDGQLTPGTSPVVSTALNTLIARTGSDGVADCGLALGTAAEYRVEASLLDDAGNPVPGPVRFNANASIASQVSYAPGQGCSILQGVSNVQDAIDRLCQSSGGGCVVAVASGEDGKGLEKALAQAALNKQSDICICLLPGEHDLGELDYSGIDSQSHLRIKGCGWGSRIVLNGALALKGFESVALEGLEIRSDSFSNNIVISDCQDVSIRSCHIFVTSVLREDLVPSLLEISKGRKILISDNDFESRIFQAATWPPIIFNPSLSADLAVLFSLRRPEDFDARSKTVASRLLLPGSGRTEIAGRIKESMRPLSSSMGREVTAAFDKFLSVLSSQNASAQDISSAMRAIHSLSIILTPAVAIVIDDPQADATIEDNHIVGALSFYGRPVDRGLLNGDQAEILQSRLKRGSITFSPSGAELRVAGNELTRIAVGNGFLQDLNNILSGETQSFANIYRLGFITNNSVAAVKNALAATDLIFCSNSFKLPPGTTDGPVISEEGTFAGNYSPDKVILQNFCKRSEKAANLLTFSPG